MALGGLRPQVGDAAVVLDRADVGLEHQVEGPGLRQVGAAAVGAMEQAVGRVGFQVIGPPALLAVAAVDQRIGEVGQVTGRLPDPRAGQDGGVEADDFVAELDHRPPPGVFDIAQHEHAEGPVVVGGAETPVDLGRREHEAALLAQPHDVVHARRHGVRGYSPWDTDGFPVSRRRTVAEPVTREATAAGRTTCPSPWPPEVHGTQPALEVGFERASWPARSPPRWPGWPARAAPRPGRLRGCDGSGPGRPARAPARGGAPGTGPRPRPGRSSPDRRVRSAPPPHRTQQSSTGATPSRARSFQ